MVDPGTATIIATAIAAAAKGGSDFLGSKKQKKAGKLRAKELRRETTAGLLNDANEGSAEYTTHGLKSRAKGAKRRSKQLQETSDLVRGALSI